MYTLFLLLAYHSLHRFSHLALCMYISSVATFHRHPPLKCILIIAQANDDFQLEMNRHSASTTTKWSRRTEQKKNRREKLWQKVQLNPTWLQKVRSETINLISDNKTNYFYLKWENNKKISYWIAEIISDSNCMFFLMNHLYRTNKPNPGIWISMGRKRGERKEVNDERIAHNRMRMTQR